MFEVSINDLLKLGLVEDIGKMIQIDSGQAKIIIEYLVAHTDKNSIPSPISFLNIEESFKDYFRLIMLLLQQRPNGFSEFDKIAPVICSKPNQLVLDAKCFNIDKIIDNLLLTENLIDVIDSAPEDNHYKEIILLLSLQGKVTIDPKANKEKVKAFLGKWFDITDALCEKLIK